MARRKGKRLKAGISVKDWEDCKAYFGYCCAYCGRRVDLTKEHVCPTKHRGKNTIFNIVPACQKCNSSKRDKDVWEWYRSKPFYSQYSEQLIRQYLHLKLLQYNEERYKKDK